MGLGITWAVAGLSLLIAVPAGSLLSLSTAWLAEAVTVPERVKRVAGSGVVGGGAGVGTGALALPPPPPPPPPLQAVIVTAIIAITSSDVRRRSVMEAFFALVRSGKFHHTRLGGWARC
jgi:hypothetical protein